MTSHRTTSRFIAALIAAAAVGTLSPMASAQVVKKEVKVDAPTPGREDADRPFMMNWLLMIALIAAIVGVNCIPSKRGHQD